MLSQTVNYRTSVYAPIREFQGKIIFTYNGTATTYLDDKIISINVVEEMNTINNTLPSNEINMVMDNTNGDFSFLTYDKMYEIIASKPKIEAFLGLVTDPVNNIVEWIPIGVFYLINYKTNVGNMSIQITGRDNFDMLSDISYNNTQQNTLYNLAVDIFTQANITNYSIDDSLKNITGSFTELIDMRTALQHIGVASRAAVYQDRNGVMTIKPFAIIDQASNYLTYSGQPQLTAGHNTTLGTGGGWAYAINSTGGGMKYIDMDYQYTEPDVQLDKSIYELIINVNSGQGNAQQQRYINTALGGNNGASFQIDNPLIETVAVADAVAQWYMRETNYNAIYDANWRQNPVLECGDIILIEDPFGANKQTRITHQEFNYTGYLEGRTQSRGGI